MEQKVLCDGKQILLNDKNFVTSGGEGSIFRKGNKAYKVYHKAIATTFENKLKELQILNNDSIISPKNILYSLNGCPIGYTMPFIDSTSSLALLFTKSFKTRNNIDLNTVNTIFSTMFEIVKYIHEKNILIVDFNELNILISNKDFCTPYFLDVDSYQTKDFPATAIMPSIRDYCSDTFSENTDWYSFAVLMFQLYAGIHPYKGLYSGDNSLEGRCKNKISVFNTNVKYPPMVNMNIPSGLKNWFFNIFEKGARIEPPTSIDSVITQATTTTSYSSTIVETLIKEYPLDIERVSFINGQLIVFTKERYYFGNRETVKKFNKEIPYFVEKQGVQDIVHLSKDKNTIKYDEEELIVPDLKIVGIIKNRIFVVSDKLYEYTISKYTNKLEANNTWTVPINATKFFANCIFIDNFEKTMFYIPEIKDNKNVVYTTYVNELNCHTIIDAYYEFQTLVAISQFNNKYMKTVIKFDSTFISYKIIQNECSIQEINATVLPSGMSLIMDEDKLELSAKESTDRKIIVANTDLILSHEGNKVLAYRGSKLYSISLQK